MEEAGVALIAQGAAAYMSDMKSATNATGTFVDTTDKGAGLVGRAGGLMGDAIKGVATIAAGVGVAGFVALGKAIFDGVGDARESAKLYASTERTIFTMGNAAGRSADQVVDLASGLSDAAGMSLFGDDQIQQSENLLLTFSNIKGETFDLATALTVDLAQALGGKPADSAMMLGKALNDPIKGITALSKAGLTFSDEQKEVIKTMVESGDIAGAQSIIIEELNRQVGGQAQAAAGAAGGMVQFKATLGELAETIGAAILPMLNSLAAFLNDTVVPAITPVVEAFGGVIKSLADAGAGSVEFAMKLGDLATALGLPGDLITDIVFAAQDLVGSLQDGGAMSSDFASNIGYLADSLGLPGDLITDIAFGVQDLVASFQEGGQGAETLGKMLDDLNGVWAVALKAVQDVGNGELAIAQSVLPIITKLWDDHGEEISAFVKTTYDSIIQIVTLALQLYDAIVPPILNAIAGFIDEHGSEIVRILTGAWEIVSSLITGVLETIKGIFTTTLAIIHGDWEGAWTGIKTIADAQMNAISGVITGFLDMIAGIFDTSMDDIGKTWEGNWNQLVDIATNTDWAQVGQDVVDGIIQGLRDAWGLLVSWIVEKMSGLVDQAIDAIDGGSPALKFTPVGESVVQGIMLGLESMWPALTSLVADLSDDLVKQAADIASQVQGGIADAFGATASIDRQIASNLDKFKDIPDQYKQYTTGALQQAQNEAQGMLDPAEGAKFFALRSKQILEYAKLQQDLAEAETQEDKDRITAKMILVNKAQTAELSGFDANLKATTSGAEQLMQNLQALLSDTDLPALFDSPAVASLTSMLRQLAEQNTALAQSYAHPTATMADVPRSNGSVSPPASPAQQQSWAASSGAQSFDYSRHVSMPVYTNQSSSVVQQSMAIAQAGMI